MEILDTRRVHADLMVFEKDIRNSKEGQPLTFAVQSVPDEERTATIYAVGKTFEQHPKALHVHAEIENKAGRLLPGLFIRARIQTDTTIVKALPQSTIATDGDTSFVFTAKKEGTHWRFTPLAIRETTRDGAWIAVDFFTPQEPGTYYTYTHAYYLMAEMEKAKSEAHGH